jgi:hypothetical protein
MSETETAVDLRRSFLRLVCPFYFRPATLPIIIRRADEVMWRSKTTAHPVWSRTEYSYLLPGVRRYINSPSPELSAAGIWRLHESYLASHQGLAGSRHWYFRLLKNLYFVQLKAVDFAVFGTGVGFVVFEFVATYPPRGRDTNSDAALPTAPATWIDLSRLLRRLLYLSIVHTRIETPSRETDAAAAASQASSPDCHSLHYEMERLLATVGMQVSPVLEEAVDVEDSNAVVISAQPITFTSLFLIEASEDQMREWTARLRYNVGSRPLYEPAPEELSLSDGSIQKRSDRSWLYGSTVAAGFIASDLPQTGFWQQFPSELRREYQLALLLTLQQRHALLSLSDLVSDRWLNADEQHRVAQFSQLQERLQYLSARLMPSQLGQRSSQQRFYATMRSAFQISDLYHDVRQTISELSESLRLRLSEEQGEQQRRFERRVSALALLFGVPSLVLAFLAIDVSGISKPVPLLIALSAVLASFALGALVGLIVRRRGF